MVGDIDIDVEFDIGLKIQDQRLQRGVLKVRRFSFEVEGKSEEVNNAFKEEHQHQDQSRINQGRSKSETEIQSHQERSKVKN